jgi:hypothetical protein
MGCACDRISEPERVLLTPDGLYTIRPSEGRSMSEQSTPVPLPNPPETRYHDIPGFPGYRVGDDGSVWTCWRSGGFGSAKEGRKPRGPKMGNVWIRLKPTPRKDSGHLRVSLGYGSCLGVHVLVLLAFIGPPPEGMECCHNDGNPANNRLDNLRWGTPKDNAADRIRHGRQLRGEMLRISKLTEAAVRHIREQLTAGISKPSIAAEHGVSVSTIYWIAKGAIWRHVD